IFDLVRMKSKPGAAQCRSASAEQETIYLRQTHGMRNKTRDLLGWKLNRVFVVHRPVDPLFVIDVCEQMQHGPLNIRGRREILDPVGVGSAKLLVGNVENKRMIRPKPVVLINEMAGDRSIPITGEHDRFYSIRKIHSRNARYLL